MDKKIFSKCGMRCDLCLIYRPNVEKEDRRVEICNAWKKIWQGFSPDPNTVICDGCCSEEENSVLFSPDCNARKCVISKGMSIVAIAASIHAIFSRLSQQRKRHFRRLKSKSSGLGKMKS